MKSKFLAGLIATLISIVVVVSLALFLALVLDIEPSKNWFTTTAAILTIGTWLGVYSKLKPKIPPELNEHGEVIEPQVNQIDATEFKKTYLRTSRTSFRVGIFLTVTCMPGGICVLTFSEDLTSGSSIAGLIILFLFGGLGVLMMYTTMKKMKAINDGTDHLMNAIANNIIDHVIWFHGVITQYQGAAVSQMKNYQITIYTKLKKKNVLLIVKNEQAYEELLAFLATKFPTAEMGYSDQIKRDMKAKYGIRGA